MHEVRDMIAKCGNKNWWREKSVIAVSVQQVAAKHYQQGGIKCKGECWSHVIGDFLI